MLALLAAPASHSQTHLPFLVTDRGIGGITAQTAYTPQAVSAALGGLPVAATTIYFDKFPISALEATRDGKRVLLAFPSPDGDRVARAVAYAPDAATSTGVIVGTLMGTVFSGMAHRGCRAGLDDQAGLVFCPAPYFDNVRFAFRCGHTASVDRLPPADVLATCPLESIMWLRDG
jgi:hypothetical protein